MPINQPMSFSPYDPTDPTPGKRVLTFRVNDSGNPTPVELPPTQNDYLYTGNVGNIVEWWLHDYDAAGNASGAASGVFTLTDTFGPATPVVTLGDQYQS